MKKLLLLASALALLSCSEQRTDALMTEPAGSAHYYINNQSSTEITVIFVTSAALNFETDSSAVPGDSSKVIFRDGGIGINPKPSDSFSNLKFFRETKRNSPVIVIDSIRNEAWKVIHSEMDDSGYGLTEYELTISDQGLE
ncbi:hypothetical protein [Fodinibius sediminis]|uniref:Lipoprotein n=1 Tax=Fodinibius sediminis TaxID=1214077 RepID=A0A521EKP4_9BACT|nr:hypothetical protein [Fodinibius sediminis]SMO84484.1 hypothetical protein SAMN06265218_11714 [Fodinibius sediminis]